MPVDSARISAGKNIILDGYPYAKFPYKNCAIYGIILNNDYFVKPDLPCMVLTSHWVGHNSSVNKDIF